MVVRCARYARISLDKVGDEHAVANQGPSLDMSTAYGRGMAGLLGESDTMESEVKAERQQLAAFHRAQNGQPPAGANCSGITAARHTQVGPGSA